MKELTIEEKAKRYDEIIKKTNKMHHKNCEACQMCIEELIPELKESENWIPKEIIKYLKEKGDFRSCWIAWLEKQVEQKPVFEMKTPEESLGVDSDTYNKIVDKCIYGEQKTADKVEPKFKVGDWIVDNNIKTPFLITDISNDKYGVISIYRNDMAFSFREVEHFYHLWTIQDAKGGDVLAIEPIEEGYQYPFVAIYKERGLDFFNSYCFIGFDGKFWEAEAGHSTKKIHPATKEQRDLLFQKMKEAGYVWDAEKKKLNKIEQKPAWSEEDENGLGDALWAIQQARTIAKDENDMGNLWYAEHWLKSLKERYTWKPSDLPHWKKSTLSNDSTTGFNSDYFCYKGYNINYKELFDKLPKGE